MRTRRLCLALVLAASFSGSASGAPPAQMRGGILVDGAGMALYTFDKDVSGSSSCYDQCAKLWPPFAAAANAVPGGAYTVIKRKDGTRQWAIRGKPLYYWLADRKPGAATGEAVAGWHLVR